MSTCKRNLFIRRCAAIGSAYLFLISLNFLRDLFGTSYAAYGVGSFGYSIGSVAGLIICAWLLDRMFSRNTKRLHCVSLLSGLLMSAALVYGTYAHYKNNIFQSVDVTLLQFALIIGIGFATVPLSEEILLLFDRLQQWEDKRTDKARHTPSPHMSKYFFIVWLLIFISYIPIFLCWWPGNFVYDAPFQLWEAIHNAYDTHHPLLHTLLMGWSYKLGVSWGNASAGFQMYTLFQMLILSASFAYCIYYLYQKGVPRIFRIGVLLWFIFFPMHAMFSITATKDVLFAAFFLWFMIFVVRLIHDCETFRWYSYAGLIATGTLCLLFRNNAFYAIAAGGILIILFEKKGWKRKRLLAVLLAAICLTGNLCSSGLATATKAQTTDLYRETLSLPLQCLGRVASYRTNELSEDNYNEICMYLREDALNDYNPYLADGTKSITNEELLEENIVNFLKLWIKVGFQFPGEYLESIITNTMGYWYPLNRAKYVCGDIDFYHKLIWTEHEIEKQNYCQWAGEYYGNLYWQQKYLETPVLGYLHRLDGWVWFLLYFLFWCLYQKNRRAGLSGAIPFMYFGTCLLGPVADLRYIYCLVVITPLLLYLVIRSRNMQPES